MARTNFFKELYKIVGFMFFLSVLVNPVFSQNKNNSSNNNGKNNSNNHGNSQGSNHNNNNNKHDNSKGNQGKKWSMRGDVVNENNFIGTTNEQDFRIKTNDSLQMVVSKDGNVGVGVAIPEYKLDVLGDIKLSGDLRDANGDIIDLNSDLWTDLGNGNISFETGNVGIGTGVTNDYKLAVNGKVMATEVKIDADYWADFIFDDNYKLSPLSEIEDFIIKNKHLPGIPSEAEVKEEGVELGNMNVLLLQKIEELTLYLIEQNKMIVQLKEEIESLK